MKLPKWCKKREYSVALIKTLEVSKPMSIISAKRLLESKEKALQHKRGRKSRIIEYVIVEYS